MATPRDVVGARGYAQRGAVSIEFALIFPVLFLIFYAIVTYGLIFSAQHTLSLAAAEGGRAAMRYQRADDPAQALSLRTTAAQAAVQRSLSWLQSFGGTNGPVQSTTATAPCAGAATLTCLTVNVSYDYGATPLVPRLPLLPTPQSLRSEAVVQLSPLQLP